MIQIIEKSHSFWVLVLITMIVYVLTFELSKSVCVHTVCKNPKQCKWPQLRGTSFGCHCKKIKKKKDELKTQLNKKIINIVR